MFALCVEASHARGLGHLFRALALAQALEDRDAAVRLYVNDYEGAARVLRERGRSWTTVPLRDQQMDWETARIRADGVRVWVDDCFETSRKHAEKVIRAGTLLATFDDRGAGAALAHLHVQAMPQAEGDGAAGRRVLSGVQYMVLDPAIRGFRRERTGGRSVVISMGGADTYGLTVDVVREMRSRGRSATVVTGPGFAHEAALAPLLNEGFTVKRSVASLVAEFGRHDLAITAGGITPFEANAAGLPCIVIAAEPWEEAPGRLLANLGGCRYAGLRGHVNYSVLDEALPIEKMSKSALATVPADGADRVAAELMAL